MRRIQLEDRTLTASVDAEVRRGPVARNDPAGAWRWTGAMPRPTPSVVAFLLVTAAAIAPAAAADSTWLVCKGIAEVSAPGQVTRVHLVASLHERRGADGESRDLAITLVRGDLLARGVVRGAALGGDHGVTGVRAPVRLTAVSAPTRLVFTGTGELASGHGSVTLVGALDLGFGHRPKAPRAPVTATLACETLDDLAIGH